MHKALIGCIRDAAITVALGTDNMSADMFQAMSIGSIDHRTGRGREAEGGVVPNPEEAEQAVRNVWRRMVDANPDIAKPRGEIPWLDADAS